MKKIYDAPEMELEVIYLEDVILESESSTEPSQGTKAGVDLDPDPFDEP